MRSAKGLLRFRLFEDWGESVTSNLHAKSLSDNRILRAISPFNYRQGIKKFPTLCDHVFVTNETVALTVTKAEALILFELLANFHEESSIQVRDQAERIALWNLSSLLEKSLVDLFSPNYKELLLQAKQKLISSRI
jgi:hypothetical protein